MQDRNKKTKVCGSRKNRPAWSRRASKVSRKGRCESPVFKKLFIHFILAMLGLHHCVRAFSSSGERGLLSSCSVQLSHRGGFSCGSQAPGTVLARGLHSCDTQAQLPLGMWDLPRPEIKPVSLALQGGFLTTVPPGKPPQAWS